MERNPFISRTVPAVLLLAAIAACEAKKSSNPLSPSVAGPIPGVEITPPKLLEPAQGFRVRENQQPIRLLIENSSSSGVRPLSYVFEVASDTEFQTKVFARAGVVPGENGRTSVQVDKLELGRPYHWRARAEDGANNSIFSVAGFEVLPKPVLNVPAPVAPVNNVLVATQQPRLEIRNSDRNSAVGAVSYFFMVARDQAFTQIAATGLVDEGSPTGWTVDRPLDYGFTHYWRVRATDGQVTSDWSPTHVFRAPSAPAPGPGPGPAPGPGVGGSCASRDGQSIVQCIAAKYPDYRRAGVSEDRRRSNMEFLRDRIIEAGVCGGLQLGWNLKRGGPELSIDFIAERRGNQTIGYDIAFDYDNTSTTLRLQWASDGPGSHYKAFPNPNCSR